MSDFTGIVEEVITDKYFKLQIYNPKKYICEFNEEYLKKQLYKEIEIPVLKVYYEYFNEYRDAFNLKINKNKILDLFKEEVLSDQFQDDFEESFSALDKFIKYRVKCFNKYINKIFKDLDIWAKDFKFKTLNKIRCFSGDSHNKGQYVCEITIDGKIFYYKPRSSKIESRFYDFLSEFLENENFVVYSKDGFSIQKNIDYFSPKNESDIEKYFYNLGIISAIFYLFNSSDMHYENMIINDTIPYFYDLETITTINHESLGKELDAFRNYLNNSIIGSNVYPAPLLSNNIDISVVTGVEWNEKNNLSNSIEVLNNESDQVKIVEVSNDLSYKKNEILINGRKINPIKYIENIASGFREVASKVLANKNEYLSKMKSIIKDQRIRQIVRPTNTYAKFLNSSFSAYYLQSEKKRNELLSILKKGMYNEYKNLVTEEIKCLNNGDIPVFFADFNSLNLYDIKGKIIEEEFFSISCEKMLEKKIENLSEMTISKQISLMKDCIYIACFNKYPRSDFSNLKVEKINYDQQMPYKLCLEYYNSFSSENGYLFNTNVIANGDKLALWFTDFSLYESAGVLLLSYMRKKLSISDEFFEKFTDTIYKLNTQLDKSFNAFNGVGSELYFLYTFYKEDRRQFYRTKIINILDYICENLLMTETLEFDFFTGVSSVLAVLSNVYLDLISDEENKDKEIETKIIHLIIRTQNFILSRRQLIIKKYKAGFAHGLAGIYYSLGLSYKCNAVKKIKELFDDLISIEEKYYVEDENNYLDPRDSSSKNYYICYGIIGILLARIELFKLGLLNKKDLEYKIDRLIDQLKIGLDYSSMSYCLCHGIASIIELMISVKSISSRKDECNNIISSLVEHEIVNCRNGYGDMIDIDSFMNGRMGKIYAIIRSNNNFIPSFTLLKFYSE